MLRHRSPGGSSECAEGCLPRVSKSFNGIYTRCVAPITFVVHAVSKQKPVSYFQAGKVCFQAWLCLAIVVFIYQCGGKDLLCTVGPTVVGNGAERCAFIQYVVHDQHGTTIHVCFRA